MAGPNSDIRPLSRSRLRTGPARARFATGAVLFAAAAIAAAIVIVVSNPFEEKAESAAPKSELLATPPIGDDQAETGFADASETDRQPPALPRELVTLSFEPPFDVIDGRTFAAGDIRIALSGISAPDADDVCVNDAGRLWACGLRARATLSNLIRNAVLVCVGTRSPEAGNFSASCEMGSEDLALALIDAGSALPLEQPPEALRARAMVAAEKARRGLWDGGWTIRSRP